MANNQNEEERLQTLEILRNSYEMYERSKVETSKIRKEKTDKDGNRIYTDKSLKDTLELMETMQADIKQKYLDLGGKEEELALKKGSKKQIDRKALLQAIDSANQKDAMREYMEKMNKEFSNNSTEEKKPVTTNEESYKKVSPKLYEVAGATGRTFVEGYTEETEKLTNNLTKSAKNEKIAENVSFDEGIRVGQDNKNGYDVIKLPSKGECYKDKMKEIEVSYLTAYDENLILSPNL